MPAAAMRTQADEGSSQGDSFAAQLNGLTSSAESESSEVTAAPRTTATATARTTTTTVRRPSTQSKDSKKANDTQGATATVVAQTANSQVLPLQFQFLQRDGSEDASGDSTDTQSRGASASLGGLKVDWNAMSAAATAAADNVDGSASAAAAQPKVRTAQPDKPAASRGSEGIGVSTAKPEMAFAARVQPATAAQETTNNNRRTSETQLSAAGASALHKASSGDAVEASDVKDTTQPATALQHVAAVFEQSGRSADVTAQPRTQAAAQTPETATVHTESSTKPAAAPLKDISMQVTQSGEEKVEIRVVQQSGEVHVAVRTGDADLTHGLRQGLTELVGKLEDNGYRADTWRPAASTAATASLSQSQDSQGASGHSHYGDSSNRQNGSQQNGGQQNQNAFNRPRWVEALESGATGEGEPTGETNGIGN
jgi:hypothetical protein